MRDSTDLYSAANLEKPMAIVMMLAVLIVSASSAVRAQAGAEQVLTRRVKLHVKPATCVALHRGQVCYQRIVFSWKVADIEQYCLFTQNQDAPLVCSNGSQKGVAHDYSSKSSETFILRQGREGPQVAQFTINTAWVYRTGSRSSSSWRLF